MEKKIDDNIFKQNINKDYTQKIISKMFCDDIKEKSEDINRIIIFFNYCFYTKNNFFIDKFNKNYIKDINLFYHNLKTNILVENNIYISFSDFLNLTDNKTMVKLLRFSLKSYLYKYEKLEKENNPLISEVNDRDVLRILSYL